MRSLALLLDFACRIEQPGFMVYGTGVPGSDAVEALHVDAYPDGQPVGPDRDAAAAVPNRNPAAGRAAVRIEADATGLRVALLAADRQQGKAQLVGQLPHPSRADLKTVPREIEVEADLPVAQDRLRAGLAEPGGYIGGGPAQAESAAPGRLVSDHEREGDAEDGGHAQDLDQRKGGRAVTAAAGRHRR